MELNIWSKTLLKSYRNLERVVKSIDKSFMNICLSSRCSSWYDSVINSTMSITERLLVLSERKILLINTKVMINEILQSMDKNLAKILILKYIKKYNNDKLSKMLNVSIRTINRRIVKAIDSFTLKLNRRGYTDERVKVLYGKELWLMDMYRRTLHDEMSLDARYEKIYKTFKLIEI